MKIGFKDYISAAFNARPIGMWVPPNWIGVGIFGVLGFLNPGFWVLGAGLELAYLYFLSSHPRFQRIVRGRQLAKIQQRWFRHLESLVARLEPDDQRRYRLLEHRCGTILDQQAGEGSAIAVAAQNEGLGRLRWLYLRLLLTRQAIVKSLRDSENAGQKHEPLEDRISKLESRLQSTMLSEELRKSYSGQVDILKQRLEKQRESRGKLAFLEAELVRIQEQAELIREQSVLSTSPEVVSDRIDQISQTLGGTTQWIKEQQQIYGSVEDLLAEPPPLMIPVAKELQ